MLKGGIMYDFEEAMEIYNEELSKDPRYNEKLVKEWIERMPEQFTRYHLKKKYGCHIVDKSMYDEAVSLFDWVDERGTGAKWSIEDIKKVAGIEFSEKEYTPMDFAYAANMFYSDFCNAFTDSNYYIRMAKNYLEDPDYMGDPSERSYKDATERIKYFSEE